MENVKAMILVRGRQRVTQTVKDTLDMLHLTKKNTCVIVKTNDSINGMIRKVNSYITYGDIDESTLTELKKKKNLLKKESKVFLYSAALNPPRKGYGRKGIKIPFLKGGALGNRKEKMSDLIKRML